MSISAVAAVLMKPLEERAADLSVCAGDEDDGLLHRPRSLARLATEVEREAGHGRLPALARLAVRAARVWKEELVTKTALLNEEEYQFIQAKASLTFGSLKISLIFHATLLKKEIDLELAKATSPP